MQRLLSFAVSISFLLACRPVAASQNGWPRQCESLLVRTQPGWKPLAPTPEVVAWAKSEKRDPLFTAGDFNGDGRQDHATLGSVEGQRKVVLCLAGANGSSLSVVHDEGCSDYIYTIKRRTRVPNLDSGKEEVLRRDAVATGCFEKSGRIFQLVGSEFRVFFHSD